jgi:hypothetical protein
LADVCYWQDRGGSVHNEPVGWKLMRLDEALGVAIIDEKSLAPELAISPATKEWPTSFAKSNPPQS